MTCISKYILTKYRNKCQVAADNYYEEISFIEDELREELNDDDLEIFISDGFPVGIGNMSRTMKLKHF